MSSATIAPPLAGQTIESAESSFVIAEWRDAGAPPGPPRWIAPLHLHHHDDEAWYVLKGRLCVKRGDETVEAGPGAAVLVPRGTPHTYWNPDPTPVRYLLIMTPMIHGLIQAIHATTDRSPEGMRALFRGLIRSFCEVKRMGTKPSFKMQVLRLRLERIALQTSLRMTTISAQDDSKID